MREHVILIGAGQASFSCAAKLRMLRNDMTITLLGDEAYFPYQRPPLTKEYLAGSMTKERLLLRQPEWYSEHSISVRTGTRVVAIDRAKTRVTLETGEDLAYDHLVIASGTRARMPSQLSRKRLKGVHTIRSLSDSHALKEKLHEKPKVLVIGGGYIGLEAAAIARRNNLSVTLVEAAPQILGRVASSVIAKSITRLHRDHDVEIYEATNVSHLEEKNGVITAAKLSQGATIPCDLIVAGVGVIPNTELCEAAGLDCEDGLIVDDYGRTNDAQIYGAGDVARFPYEDRTLRLESVGHAIDHGELVARNIAGEQIRYRTKPWFWSHQYHAVLQMAGLSTGYDDIVMRGDEHGEKQKFAVWLFREGRLIAVEAMNDPRTYMIGKRLIESGRSLPRKVLSDPTSNLKAWLEA